MGIWKIKFTKQAAKDLQKLASANLEQYVIDLLSIMKKNPFANPPSYEKLHGELKGYYSRRINLQHRLVYQVFKEAKTVKIVRAWTHYE